MPCKKTPCKTTSAKVASKAAKVLADPKSSKTDKAIAGSALAQKEKKKRS